jgi:hypothetical protein
LVRSVAIELKFRAGAAPSAVESNVLEVVAPKEMQAFEATLNRLYVRNVAAAVILLFIFCHNSELLAKLQ